MQSPHPHITPSCGARFKWVGLLCLLTGALIEANASDLEKEKRLHEQLWNHVVNEFDVKTRIQANSRETILTEIEILEGPLEFTGTTPIKISPALAPHVRNFSYLEIAGEGLDQIHSVAYKVTGGIVYTNPQLQTKHSIQIPGSLFADWLAGQQTLLLNGSATLKKIRLVSLEGISSVFDESRFRIADNSQAPFEMSLLIKPQCTLSLDGVKVLPVDRFFRLYFTPGDDRSGMEDYFAQKGFYPGRQMLKLAHELETRHGTYKEPLLREDLEKPGHADLSIFNLRNFNRFKNTDPELEFAQCFNIWPSFMDADIPGEKNVLGTPAIDAFDAAAELAAAYIADETKDSGRTATYWEVKNESDIKHEWAYHGQKRFDSWTLLAEFHNKVAGAIKQLNPEIKVGGPTSAWPRMEMGHPPFLVWKNHKKFMELTRDDLDFYSHHFYDTGVTSSFNARSEGYEDWLQGRLDCVLDLICAEMQNKDNIKPLLITEYGTLAGGTREIDYWLRVSNYSSFMIQFMQRPADFSMTVPFLLGYMHWEPNSGFALVRKNQEGHFELTKNSYFLDLWEGVGGNYIKIENIHPKVHSLGWKNGSKIYIAVNNQSGEKLKITPTFLLDQANNIKSINYRKASYQNGRFTLQRGSLPENFGLTLPDAETLILIAETSSPVETNCVLAVASYYGDQTVLALSKEQTVKIRTQPCKEEKIISARLRIGIRDPSGPSGSLKCSFNNYEFNIHLANSSSVKNFFEFAEVDIPVAYLREENTVRFNALSSGTIISHTKLVVTKKESN